MSSRPFFPGTEPASEPRRHLDRRSFLAALGLSTGGLLLAGNGVAWAAGTRRPLAPNVFVHLAPNGQVTIVCHRTEMGQGVRSTLPALIADELGADVAAIRIVQADGDEKYGDQNTDGSSSVRKRFQDLRVAGATARVMLETVAARRLGVPAGELVTEGGHVNHPPSKRSLAFAELVTDAAALEPPAKPALKPRAQHRHIGSRNFTLVDGPDLVTGKAVFGSDVKLPGLLTAVVLHPPTAGGELKRYDATKALAIDGVKQVVELPAPSRPYGFKSLGGLAVVATTTWAALRGRHALEATWDLGDNAVYESNAYRDQLTRTIREPGSVARSTGHVDDALASAAIKLEAEYFMPHLAHAPMEPPTATAHVHDGRCEVWAATQNPQAARDEVADALGLPKDKVTMHVTLVGGGFGRKSKPDYVIEAALVAKAVGAPVRLQWTREDDIRHDYFHTTSAQRLEAGLDAQGNIVAWKHRTAFPPIASLYLHLLDHAAGQELGQGYQDFPLHIPNVQLENGAAKAHTRIGWMRSVHNLHSSFGISCFIDELAHARKKDPKDNLLEVLGPPRIVTPKELGVGKLGNYGQPLEEYPIDTGRMRAVIERVCAASKWSERASDPGRGYGLAFHRSFLCNTAVVVAVKQKPDGRVRVDEVWLCADAGLVVNRERAESQMEGAVLFGMSLAMFSAITFKDGVAQQSNFHDYRLARMPDAPRAIHVDLVESEEKPGGIGEPGVPPVAPALFNAVFALTGKRVRTAPLSAAGVV